MLGYMRSTALGMERHRKRDVEKVVVEDASRTEETLECSCYPR